MMKLGTIAGEGAWADPEDMAAAACEALLARALALDAMFTKLAGLASQCRADWPVASARYARLALRAQARCRASVEDMLKIQRAMRRGAEASVETLFAEAHHGKSKKQPNNPMQPNVTGDQPTAGGAPQPEILANAPRCGARTRAGAACRSPAVGGMGRRCRMHGGKGSGAPRGNRNAWKHGVRSAGFAELVRELRAIEDGAG